ncbi:MAG: ABC transporter [Acidobacteria bacterium RIFCSPLOWO2_12_FULL_66_10]|nr:MAG: ABC transporter [Acidobacteria bacterium RIFCSPLOWO2_12_FULL_66_10]
MSDPFVIETAALKKDFDGIEALRGLSLQVPSGSIYGFLGRNGAGKTTTIKILLGLCRPTSGSARVFGLAADDPEASVAIRQRVAFVSEEKDLYDYMTVGEMIAFTRPFYPRWRDDRERHLLGRFELPRDRKVKGLSRGMRTKLALLLALGRGAELLILDEPTSGLDPAMTDEVLQALVAHVTGEQMTVFFSSHQIAEVDQIADQIAIIDRGQAVVSGSLDDLRQHFRRIQLVFDGDAPDAPFHAPGVRRVRRKGRVLTILTSAGAEHIVEQARLLHPVSIDVVPVTLRDIFLETVAVED